MTKTSQMSQAPRLQHYLTENVFVFESNQKNVDDSETLKINICMFYERSYKAWEKPQKSTPATSMI